MYRIIIIVTIKMINWGIQVYHDIPHFQTNSDRHGDLQNPQTRLIIAPTTGSHGPTQIENVLGG